MTAKMAGIEVTCLIDILTLVSLTFYKEKLESICSRVHGVGRILTLQGANGLEIPYL